MQVNKLSKLPCDKEFTDNKKSHGNNHDPSTMSANAMTDALANVSLTHHKHVGQENTDTLTDTRSMHWLANNQGIGQYNTAKLKIQ